ncbi:MAG: hypothetical protein AB1846_00645 [Chloroflexota bacterium]
MIPIKVFLETGKKKAFTGAVDWPGWCRSGRDEESALRVLLDCGPRYARVLQDAGVGFQPPVDVSGFSVIERHAGNITTNFGAPDIILDADREPLDRAEFERLRSVLLACWRAFDQAVEKAEGRELQKGPRGGGRDLDRILDHVLGADQSYLSRIAWKHKIGGDDPAGEIARMRDSIQKALDAAMSDGLPEQGPRGGVIWPLRFYVRRAAWHILDHAWEIEDRIV